MVMTRPENTIRIYFTQDSEIQFIEPESGRKAWYGSDYGRGTYIDVVDVISGNKETVRVRCLDGEIGILRSNDIRFGR